ncbi:MAG: hypothetical protein FWG78_05045 [Coriobacteriia bacterium]|nr:hypothetical protein [Coriobacteriia bacterium]
MTDSTTGTSSNKKNTAYIAALVTLIVVVATIGFFVWQSAEPLPIEEESTAELANPIVDYDSITEMEEVTGIPMEIPAGATILLIQTVQESINQVTVDYQGIEAMLRKTISASPDISGAIQQWESTETRTVDGVGEVTISQLDDQGIIVWNYEEFAYSIYVAEGFDAEVVIGLVANW